MAAQQGFVQRLIEMRQQKKGCGWGREILPFGMRGRDNGSKRGTMKGDMAAEASAGQ